MGKEKEMYITFAHYEKIKEWHPQFLKIVCEFVGEWECIHLLS